MTEVTAQGVAPGGEERTELKRVIGPKLLFFFVIGDILGTGIYALTGNVAGRIGGALWVPFVGAFLVAFVPLERLAGTSSLLLLAVFTLVNIACLVLRKNPVDHEHFPLAGQPSIRGLARIRSRRALMRLNRMRRTGANTIALEL